MLDTQTIFARYQSIRPRLPKANFDATTRDIQSLLDIREEVDAFVFDAFGVLNVGETPIPGAAARLDELRASGHQIRILSNAASYDHQGATTKFQMLGMQVTADEIVTSRDAALANLNDVLWGCIATPTDDLKDIPARVLRLDTDRADFDRVDGFLFLSTQTWHEPQQKLLRESLVSNPRPVMIANADLAAPRDFGFSLEPGYFGHLMADDGLPDIRFFGKPFPEVFEIAEASLQGISPDRIAMCGDTLHTDILGAAARGWRTVLVTQDGMFAGHNAQAYCSSSLITPDWTTKRI